MKNLMKTLLVIFVGLTLISCGGDDGAKRVRPGTGGGGTTTPGGGTGGAASQGSLPVGQFIARGIGDSLPGLANEFVLDLDFYFVEGSSDRISALGDFEIGNLTTFAGCNFQPGSYEVVGVNTGGTENPADYSLSNIDLEASNGRQVIRMTIKKVNLDGNGGISCNRIDDSAALPLLGDITIESVSDINGENSQSCVQPDTGTPKIIRAVGYQQGC